jgi:hypothetical protein
MTDAKKSEQMFYGMNAISSIITQLAEAERAVEDPVA